MIVGRILGREDAAVSGFNGSREDTGRKVERMVA